MNLDNKSIIVVGSSGTLTNSGLGKKIDQFDVVIRVNNAQTINGYQDDVGSKFDIWTSYSYENKHKLVMNYFESMYKDSGFSFNDMLEYLSQVKELWITTWNHGNLLHDWKKNDTLKKYKLDSRIQRIQSVNSSNKCRNDLGARQSTGFSTIWCLMQSVDKIYITGIDAFGAIGNNNSLHYYDNDTIDDWKNNAGVHKESKEGRYISNLINNNRIEMLTKETDIKKSKLIRPYLKKKCSICKKYNYNYSWENFNICHHCKKEMD